MRLKSLFIVVLLTICFVQADFGQKVKPRPTPTKKQTKLTEKQKSDILAKIDALIVRVSEKYNPKAKETFEPAIKDFSSIVKLIDSYKGQLGDKGKEYQGLAYFSLGSLYFYSNSFEKSAQNIEKSVKLFEQIGENTTLLPSAYNVLAAIYAKLNNPLKTAENYGNSVIAFKNLLAAAKDSDEIIKLKTEVAENLFSYCDALLFIGEKLKALEAVQESYALFSETNQFFKKAGALGRIARINQETGNTQKALEYYKQTLELARNEDFRKANPIGAAQLEAVTLNSLGHLYSSTGEREKGFELFQKALEICRLNNTEEPKPLILNNLGYYFMSIGDYSKAIETLSESVEISKKLGDEKTAAITLNNIGASYFEIYNFKKAVEIWDEAIEISMKINDIGTLALIVTNNSNLLIEAGEVEKALEFVEIARQYFEKSNDQPRMANILSILGRISQKKGDYQTAYKYFNDSNVLAKKIGDKRLLTTNQFLISGLFLLQKDFENASQNFLKTLQLANENNESQYSAYSLLGLAGIAKNKKNLPLAILYGKKAINQFQIMRVNIKSLDKETQTIFLENIKEAYQLVADLLISEGRIAEAEQVLALIKEEELYEYVRRDDKVAKELTAKLSLTDEETAAFKRYNEFSENIAVIGKEYSILEAEKRQLAPNQPFTKQARLDDLAKKLKDSTEVFLKFLDELKVEFGEENARVAQVDSGLQAMLKEMKAHDTVIISTIASAERLNIILTTDSFQKAYTVDIASANLNKLVADFRKAVQNPAVDPRILGQKLYNILLKPLEKDLAGSGAKTLVWSLDGTLRYVPLSALWDGNKYLAERYANAVITLASRDKLKDLPSDKSAWKTVGFGVSKAATVEETEAGAPVKRQFDALASVPEELCKVVNDSESAHKCADKGIIAGRRFLDEQFTLQEFRNQLGKFPLVHIASHFSLKAGNDKNSYLLLGGGDERKLSIAELNRANPMFVGVELLTLSACNTAMTGEKKANGVEIEGFGAIAQKQGAKSVLATLWSVADPSTRDLMNEFYTFLNVQNLSKAESLRQAQIKLIYGKYSAEEINKKRSDLAGEIPADVAQIPFQKDENRPFAHPYYWSPFVLIGNWQ